MKKLYILFVALFTFNNANAQDWNCFIDSTAVHYIDSLGNFSVIHFDSVSNENGCSFSYNFNSLNVVNYYSGVIEYSVGPSWMGKYMLVDSTGSTFFFTKEGDTLLFRTLAPVGSTWIFTRFDSTSRIEALVSSCGIADFLGISDSIKTISFIARDIVGNVIDHPFNSVTLSLSKHYGLLQVFNFYLFDNAAQDPVNLYSIAGISSPESGQQNLSKREVYSYSVGDEFHTEDGLQVHIWTHQKVQSVNVILSVTWTQNQDSVAYLIQRTSHDKGYSDGWSWDIYTRDTITQGYLFINTDFIDAYSNQAVVTNIYPEYVDYLYMTSSQDYNYRRVKTSPAYFSLFGQANYCTYVWNENQDYFIDGCGSYYYIHYTEDMIHYSTSWYKLTYYKKGQETWGTPYDTIGWFSAVPPNETSINSLNVFPNPSNGLITIETPDTPVESQLTILNMSGQEILKKTITEPTTQLDISYLPAGIYFLRLANNKTIKTVKFIKH